MEAVAVKAFLAAMLVTLAAGQGAAEPEVSGDWPTASWPDHVERRSFDQQAEGASNDERWPYHFEIYDTHIQLDGVVEQQVGREVIVIHTAQGLDRIGDLTMTYVPSEEDLYLIHLRRKGAGSEDWEDMAYRVELAHAGKTAGMYVDERTVAFIPEGLKAGDTIDFAYMIRRHITHRWSWVETDAYGGKVKSRKMVFDVPRDMELYHFAAGFPGLTEELGRRRRYSVVIEKIEPAAAEAWLPADYSPYKTLLVSTSNSWKEIAAEYAETLARIPVSEKIRRTAKAMTKGLRKEKIPEVLAAWVQGNIRYVGIETASHKMEPADPALTFERGYGDCKDMSLLLVHMLTAVGLEAWPAMVRTEELGPVIPKVPMLSAFNHEIVALRSKGGFLFIDPTLKEAVPPWSNGAREGSYALVADKEIGLVKVGPQPDALDDIRVDARLLDVSCSDGGTGCLKLVVKTEYRGPSIASMRRRLLESAPAQLEADAVSFFKTAFAGRTLLSMEHDYSGAEKPVSPLVITETFTFGQGSPGDRCPVRYLPPELNEWFALPSLSGRRSPLGTAHPRKTVVSLTSDARHLGEIEQIPAWTHEDPFVRMTRETIASDGGLRVTWTAETLCDTVPLGRLPAFAASMNKAASDAELLLCGTTGEAGSDGPSMTILFCIIFFVFGSGLGLWAGYSLGRRSIKRGA